MASDAETVPDLIAGRCEHDDSVFRWARECSDCISLALSAAAADALERAAKVADLDAERTKHTSHADGIGMGCQREEAVALRIAVAIRALSCAGGEEGERG